MLFCVYFTSIGNPVDPESSDDTSVKQQDYEVMTESNLQPREGGNLPPNQSTPHEVDVHCCPARIFKRT